MKSNITISWLSPEQQEQMNEARKKEEEVIEARKKTQADFWNFSIFYQNWYFLEWKTDDWGINDQLFGAYAMEIAKMMESKNTTPTKIRQYYNIVNEIYQSKAPISKSKLYLMLAKANYDLWRWKVSKELYDFLKCNIFILFNKKIWENTKQKLTIFKKHFEAVLAYSKAK